ncbi:hypothetical protein [Pseudomonas sp. RIT-PI-AD]|uniref:hypothetical protein n=1 Tax=Pseudomonas sp. RIT-PI-AD TaxID=3035294 RepID=UPI0021D8FA08|nr:hypothetical protein [Pseudomonas sp. RIT-PI-AD]
MAFGENAAIEAVRIERFEAASPACGKSDLPQGASTVANFFSRPTQVSSEALIREYRWVPCMLEGTLPHGESCHWTLHASAIGSLACRRNPPHMREGRVRRPVESGVHRQSRAMNAMENQ